MRDPIYSLKTNIGVENFGLLGRNNMIQWGYNVYSVLETPANQFSVDSISLADVRRDSIIKGPISHSFQSIKTSLKNLFTNEALTKSFVLITDTSNGAIEGRGIELLLINWSTSTITTLDSTSGSDFSYYLDSEYDPNNNRVYVAYAKSETYYLKYIDLSDDSLNDIADYNASINSSTTSDWRENVRSTIGLTSNYVGWINSRTTLTTGFSGEYEGTTYHVNVLDRSTLTSSYTRSGKTNSNGNVYTLAYIGAGYYLEDLNSTLKVYYFPIETNNWSTSYKAGDFEWLEERTNGISFITDNSVYSVSGDGTSPPTITKILSSQTSPSIYADKQSRQQIRILDYPYMYVDERNIVVQAGGVL